MIRLTIIRPSGAVEHHPPQADLPTLEWLQAQVEGYIEAVPYLETYEDRPCKAWANEEGKLRGLPLNPGATEVWREAVRPHVLNDVLVGTVVIVSADTARELRER